MIARFEIWYISGSLDPEVAPFASRGADLSRTSRLQPEGPAPNRLRSVHRHRSTFDRADEAMLAAVAQDWGRGVLQGLLGAGPSG